MGYFFSAGLSAGFSAGAAGAAGAASAAGLSAGLAAGFGGSQPNTKLRDNIAITDRTYFFMGRSLK